MVTSRTSATRHLLMPFACLFAGVGCHEERPPFDPLLAVTIETSVTPTSLAIGERATVTCTRFNGHGEPVPGGSYGIGVDPTELVYVEGAELFSHRAGRHNVSCNDFDAGLVDTSPVPIDVSAGVAVRTAITLSPATIQPGELAQVKCEAQDEYGNPAGANLRLEVTPTDSVTMTDITAITATTAGDYEVLCFAANVPEEDRARATLTVVPGPRVGMVLHFMPEQLAYLIGQHATVSGQGVDAYDNRIDEEIPVDGIDATPGGHHRVGGGNNNQIWFDLEGIYTVTAKSIADPTVTAASPLVVDQTRPVLTLTSPPRGLVTDSLSAVTLAGNVSDNLGKIAELRVGDLAIPIPEAGGDFSIQVPLKYAANLLDVHATDPYGNEALATRAVEKSSQYYDMREQTFAANGVDNGLVLVLLQEVFDDGDRTEATRDDLATIFEFVIESLDIASLLPNPLTSFSCINGQCTLLFDSVTVDDVIVTLTLTPGRLHMRAELVKLTGNITLLFPCDVAVICAQRPVQPLPGKIETDRVVLDTDIFLAIVDGETTTQTENTVMQLDGLKVSIEDPTGIGQAAIDLVITFVREPLIDALENLVVGLIQDELAKALDGLFAALNINQEVALPSPIPGAPPNYLVIQTKPKGVDIAPERMQLRVDGLVYAKFPQLPHEHLGSLDHRGCAPTTALAFPPPTPIELGVHDDFLNQLLFAIWEGGTLSLDLGPEEAASLVGNFGLQDAHIKVDALLPPVFDSCGTDGVTSFERVQVGDLYLDAEALFAGAPVHLGLWIATEAPVTVEFVTNDEGALVAKLVLGALDPMFIDVVINEGYFANNDAQVITLVRDALVPQLLSTLTDSASFALPSIDLGAMTTAVPAGTVINIDVRQVARDNAYLTVQGALE